MSFEIRIPNDLKNNHYEITTILNAKAIELILKSYILIITDNNNQSINKC